MNIVTVIILIVLGIICAVIHKNKGYLPNSNELIIRL